MMKKIFLVSGLACLLSACVLFQQPEPTPMVGKDYSNKANNNILHVDYDSKVGSQAIVNIANQHNAEIIKTTAKTVSIKLTQGNINSLIWQLQKTKGVQDMYLEEVYRFYSH